MNPPPLVAVMPSQKMPTVRSVAFVGRAADGVASNAARRGSAAGMVRNRFILSSAGPGAARRRPQGAPSWHVALGVHGRALSRTLRPFVVDAIRILREFRRWSDRAARFPAAASDGVRRA